MPLLLLDERLALYGSAELAQVRCDAEGAQSMNPHRSITFDPFAERDREAKKLKQAYSRAKLAKNKVEMTRIEQLLKYWGMTV
jgi:hypothetical protein